jgi:hypothetical protein
LAWISHFYGAHVPISHFWAQISHFLPLFQKNSHFSSLSPVGLNHASPPNDMVTTIFLACYDGLARAGRSLFDMLACEKWEIRAIAQEKWEIRVKSEKFEQKVRNWRVPAGKVRNLPFCAGKVRNSSQKWEIRAKSEKFAW